MSRRGLYLEIAAFVALALAVVSVLLLGTNWLDEWLKTRAEDYRRGYIVGYVVAVNIVCTIPALGRRYVAWRKRSWLRKYADSQGGN